MGWVVLGVGVVIALAIFGFSLKLRFDRAKDPSSHPKLRFTSTRQVVIAAIGSATFLVLFGMVLAAAARSTQ